MYEVTLTLLPKNKMINNSRENSAILNTINTRKLVVIKPRRNKTAFKTYTKCQLNERDMQQNRPLDLVLDKPRDFCILHFRCRRWSGIII